MNEKRLQAESTRITSRISPDQLKKVGTVPATQYGEPVRTEGFIVRIPAKDVSVTIRVNAKRMRERREIERENESIRAGE